MADPFGKPSETFPGIYRGVVEVTSDPQQRKRMRVRVANIHPQEVEADHLPWAEIGASFGGGGFGDLPAFEVGDGVWVMFEGGDRRFPVVMGGILNFDGGIPPLPAEQTGDYNRTQQRWTRIDRKGSKLEISPLDEELWIKMETADGSKVQVSSKDGTILLQAEGRVQVSAPAVQIVAAESITATTQTLTADVEDTATLRCRGTTNIRAADEVNIGEYQPEATGPIPPTPETSLVVNIKAAQTVKIESAGNVDVDSAGAMTIDSASTLYVKSVNDMTLESDAKITILAQADTLFDLEGKFTFNIQGNTLLDIEGTTTIKSAQKILVECSADIEVTATSTFKLTAGSTITVEGNANVSIDAAANMDLTATGQINLESSSRIVLSAPVVTIDADSLAEVLGGSTVRVDGGVILVG